MFARRVCGAPICSRLPTFASKSSSSRVPIVSRSVTTTSTSTAPDAPAVPLSDPSKNPHAATPLATQIQPLPAMQHESRPVVHPTTKQASPAPPSAEEFAQPVPEAVTTLLPALTLQRPHYATVLIHARPYLVTEGDRVRLPFLMPGVQPGDVLRLTRASALGSRDFTLKGAPYVDGRVFECRAVIAGVEAEPMRVMDKTKRRNRRVKHVKSKHRYTELVISELRVKSIEEVQADAAASV